GWTGRLTRWASRGHLQRRRAKSVEIDLGVASRDVERTMPEHRADRLERDAAREQARGQRMPKRVQPPARAGRQRDASASPIARDDVVEIVIGAERLERRVSSQEDLAPRRRWSAV